MPNLAGTFEKKKNIMGDLTHMKTGIQKLVF